jgi:CelD/BcsL family acetyltransferase involved in cellulose biosynthesis
MSSSQAVSHAREIPRHQRSLDIPPDWCPLAPRATADTYSVQVVETIAAIEGLRPVWRRWAHSLETDIDYFLHKLAHDFAILRPCVITVCDGGVARAMLVGQVRKRRASTVVSFLNIPGPQERVLEIRKGGRMGQPSGDIDRLLAMELLKIARRGDVDALCLERLPLHSELLRQIQHLRGLSMKERIPYTFCYSVLSLTAPERKRSRVFSGKTRREVRRKTRILERAFPEQVQMKCFSKPSELDAGMCDAMRVAVTTWQYYLGLGLTDTAQTRETFRFFAKRDWLRIYVVYIKETPCAFLVGQLYNNTFHCQYAGYHPNYTRFSVGCLLTAWAFEDLAAAGVHRVDLGEGGHEHNRRLGCHVSEEGTVHLYSPTLRGLCLNVFFGTTQAVRRGGRHTKSAFQLDRLGKLWRQYRLSRWQSRQSSSRTEMQP